LPRTDFLFQVIALYKFALALGEKRRYISRMSIFLGLGRALRWLRDRQGKRQYQVADAAGITKAMLSAYETGKQKPSLDTMEKILSALECDLNDLHNALQIVNERPEAIRRSTVQELSWPAPRREAGSRDGGEAGSAPNVYNILGISRPLPVLEEQALSQMLQGFHKLVRYLHESISQAPRDDDEAS
jgi:transcriptional regulator with XRE-family HTH domain